MLEVQLLGTVDMERTLRNARSIAVLGIKPESRRDLDAHQIPLYLQKVGDHILPVIGFRICVSIAGREEHKGPV